MNKKVKIIILVLAVLILLAFIFRDQIGAIWYEITTPIGPGGMPNDGIGN